MQTLWRPTLMQRSLTAVVLLWLVASGCTSRHDPAGYVGSFAVRPLGEDSKLTDAKPQSGTRGLPDATRQTFREITIAQGSGLLGFDTIRIFADGSGYAIAGLDNARAIRVPLQLSNEQLGGLLRAIRQDRLVRIKGSYSSGVHDGAQGFVELITTDGRVYSWLDNYFKPVSHVYTFCNRQVWPEVKLRLRAYPIRRNVDLYEEHHRVFRRKS